MSYKPHQSNLHNVLTLCFFGCSRVCYLDFSFFHHCWSLHPTTSFIIWINYIAFNGWSVISLHLWNRWLLDFLRIKIISRLSFIYKISILSWNNILQVMNLVQGNLALMKDTQLMSLFLSPVLAIACHTFFYKFHWYIFCLDAGCTRRLQAYSVYWY